MGKKKKEKVIYIDDGRTIADMSGVTGTRLHRPPNAPRSSAKERWNTYWSAVRMVFPTMITFIVILCILYLVAYLFLQIF